MTNSSVRNDDDLGASSYNHNHQGHLLLDGGCQTTADQYDQETTTNNRHPTTRESIATFESPLDLHRYTNRQQQKGLPVAVNQASLSQQRKDLLPSLVTSTNNPKYKPHQNAKLKLMTNYATR